MSKMSKSIAVLGVVAGLGVAALPLSTYAANLEENVNLNVTVSELLELDATTNDIAIASVNNNKLDDAAVAGNQWGETVLTAKSGSSYNIFVKTSDTNLVNSADSTTPIPAGTPTLKSASATVASAWGLKNATSLTGLTGVTTDFGTYKGLSTDPQQFVHSDNASGDGTTTASNTGDKYTARFGVTTATNTKPGTYTGSATFTLMANV